MKHKVFGVTTNSEIKFEDKFETLFDDCEAFFESKETFHHEDETSFDYKYCVEVVPNEEETFIGLYIVPTFESLCQKEKESIMSHCCVDEGDVNMFDICQYGDSILFGSISVPNDDKEWSECEAVTRALEDIANVFETMNSLRGFYLDKPVNIIGTTGWDLVESYMNGKDWIKTTLDRAK